jgi:sugar-specific transcriptional regulator TrmB
MLQKQLEQFGLNKNEITVYLSLFDLGRARAGEIIKKTQLHRNLVYQALETLSKKHLVSKINTGGVMIFQTTDPSHFLDSLEEQSLITKKLIASLKEKEKHAEQNIIIYEGKEGIQTFNLKNAKNIKNGEVICVMASGGSKFENQMETSIKKYFRMINDNKGKIKLLMYEGQKYSGELLRFVNNLPAVEIRYIPTEQNLSANFVITPKSVGVTIYDNPATVIEINNQHLVQTYLAYFDILWGQDVYIARGEAAANEAYYKMLEELAPGESYDVLGANIGLKDTHGMNEFYDVFHAKRVAKGVTVNMLSYDSLVNDITQRFIRSNDKELKISHIKPINIGLPKSMQVNMYHGKIFITLTGEKEPIIISSDKPSLYQGFKSYFDLLWNQNSWTFYGEDGLEKIRNKILETKKDIYLIGANQSLQIFGQPFHKQRAEKQLRLHMVLQDIKPAEHLGKIPLASVKKNIAPPSPITTLFFGNFFVQIIWTEKPTILLLEDAAAVEKHLEYFQNLKK